VIRLYMFHNSLVLNVEARRPHPLFDNINNQVQGGHAP